MSAAFVFILLTPLLWRAKDELWLLLMGSVALLRVLNGGRGDSFFTGTCSVYAFLSPFLFGAIFARYGLFERCASIGGGKRWAKICKLIVALWFLIASYKLYQNVPVEQFWELRFGVFPVVFVMICVEYLLSVRWLREVLGFLGRHSMNIYMIHEFFRPFAYVGGHFMVDTVLLLGISLAVSMVIVLVKRVLRYNWRIGKLIDK